MNADRLLGPRGTLRNGEVAMQSHFLRCKTVQQRLGWQWVARNKAGQVLVVYQVEDWSDSGEDGALWQLRELAASVFFDARAYRGQ